jgi:hypothetical protein
MAIEKPHQPGDCQPCRRRGGDEAEKDRLKAKLFEHGWTVLKRLEHCRCPQCQHAEQKTELGSGSGMQAEQQGCHDGNHRAAHTRPHGHALTTPDNQSHAPIEVVQSPATLLSASDRDPHHEHQQPTREEGCNHRPRTIEEHFDRLI